MGLLLAHYYEDTTRREYPFTHLLQAKLPSIGQKYGFTIPDILLTMQYSLDAKGDVRKEPLLTFQPDGPCNAQLNFSHQTLVFTHTHSICRFQVSMDALYVKGDTQVATELGKRSLGTRTTLHGNIEGMLSSRENLLEIWGILI